MKGFIRFCEDIFISYKAYILALFFLGVSLALYSNQENNAVRSFRVVGIQVVSFVHDFFSTGARYFGLAEENARLATENKRLTAELQTFTSTEKISKRMSELTPFIGATGKQGFLIARIIHRRYNETHNAITINKGERDGVTEDAAVIAEQGLVGRVVMTTEGYAVVQPVLHTDFMVAVVTDSTKIHAIVQWYGAPDRVRLRYVPRNSVVLKGEDVYTSNLSSFCPEGIKVGTVVSVLRREEELFSIIEVKLSVDFSRLDFVFVSSSSGRSKRWTDTLYKFMK